MKITYIYLIENIPGGTIYIGKTVNPTNRKHDHKAKFGTQIQFTIIDQIESINKEDWTPLEKYWISQFKSWGFTLLNKNDGGGGSSNAIITDEHRIKIGKANSKPKPEGFGNHLVEMAKNLGKNNIGRKYTEEQKEKMKKPKPKDFGEKISKALKGKTRSSFKKGPNKNSRPDIGKPRVYKKRMGKPRGPYKKSTQILES